METTRFFYCDGAVDEYLKEHMKASSKDNYYKEIQELVKNTNHTLRYMMEAYINNKQQKHN